MEREKRYNNLLAEIKRANLSIKEVASAMGISVSAFYSRLNGVTKFRLTDMKIIQDLIEKTTDQRLSLDYLFKYD